MRIFSVPRPNGSAGERAGREAIFAWLSQRRIPCRLQPFRQYPWFFETLGAWLILSRLLLAAAVWSEWGIWTLWIAVAAGLGGALDARFHLPVVTWPGACWGQNILIEFTPESPRRELILSAHYDSKTELLDHRRRMFFLRAVPFGLGLTFLVGFLSLPAPSQAGGEVLRWANRCLSLLLLVLSAGYGLNLMAGRLVTPSQGAVDNGAACAILLALADRLSGDGPPPDVRVTLALFSGEEVDRQGSRAYVRSRDFPLPVAAVNLEVMGQNGPYVLWDREGSVFGLKPTTEWVNAALREAVQAVAGTTPLPGGPVTSDGASFLFAGIPTAILGTYDRELRDTGFHRPGDRLERVSLDRLPEAVEILEHFLYQSGREE